MTSNLAQLRTMRDALTNPFLSVGDIAERMKSFNQPGDNAYPRYDIVNQGEFTLLQVALAGFSREDLDISTVKDTLTIKGKKKDQTDYDKFFHKGISAKPFELNFKMRDNVVIDQAEYKDGLLKIQFTETIPEEDKPVQVLIS